MLKLIPLSSSKIFVAVRWMLALQAYYSQLVARPGEQPGERGRIGVHRAKVWLDKSTRIAQVYTAYDQTPSAKLLTFPCGNGHTASFDIGGTFRGGDLHDKTFLVEVKSYGSASDPYRNYKLFLSLCYMALLHDEQSCHNFLFITWRAFKSDKWEGLTSTSEVIDAVVDDRERVFGTGVDADVARTKINVDAAADVASRLWLIVLNERQEQQLVITNSHYGLIMAQIHTEAVSCLTAC